MELTLSGVTYTASMMRIGFAEQFQYILRDESMHLNLGIDVINQIKIENPHVWGAEVKEEASQMILQGTQLESTTPATPSRAAYWHEHRDDERRPQIHRQPSPVADRLEGRVPRDD